MSRTSILDGIRIASPCRADWESMEGDDRTRFCSGCRKNVYNISAMTMDQASALIAGREGKLCVRLYLRPDGTILSSDCPIGSKPGRKGRLARVANLTLVGLALASTVLVCLTSGRDSSGAVMPGIGVSLDDWAAWARLRLGWAATPPAAPTVLMGEPAPILGEIVLVPPPNPTPATPAPGDGPDVSEGP